MNHIWLRCIGAVPDQDTLTYQQGYLAKRSENSFWHENAGDNHGSNLKFSQQALRDMYLINDGGIFQNFIQTQFFLCSIKSIGATMTNA